MHGYRANRSTKTAMLSMYDRWVSAAAQGQASGVVMLDLSAAFDLVEPNYLIQKLSIYGLDAEFIDWVRSYLTNRKQAVWINHVFSDLRECSLGVPQGSNLGPLFFMIYFNDLLYSLNCNADNYADDTTLTVSSKSLLEIEQSLSNSCLKVGQWMEENKLKLNASKTHVLTVGTAKKLQTLNGSIGVYLNGVRLSESENKCESVLGCIVASDLKWKIHIQSVVQKLKSRLQGLRMLSHIAPFHVKMKIANGVFNSVLVYCLPLYGGTEAQNIRLLQVLQNQAAQIVCQAKPRANRNELFDKVGWLTVIQLVVYHTLLTVFKIRKSREPEYLANILCNDSRGGRIHLPRFNLQIAQRSFSYRGVKYWNMLPGPIQNSRNDVIFRKQAKEWVVRNISRFVD